jgi:hypothetical protein
MAQMIARRAPASTTPKTYPFPIEDPEKAIVERIQTTCQARLD